MRKPFLTAQWRKLAMANYAVDPSRLIPYLPYKTELDFWNDTCYVSLVSFMFLDTAVKGIRVPYHINFEETNLRFYVRHFSNGEWRRGVVFIREIVPRRALALVANTLYNENYVCMPMQHRWQHGETLSVSYGLKKKTWHTFQVDCEPGALPLHDGSEEEFITQHFWGYTQISNNKALEYRVDHEPWKVYPVKSHALNFDFSVVYGEAFGYLNGLTPKSVFLAEGSDVVVREGVVIT